MACRNAVTVATTENRMVEVGVLVRNEHVMSITGHYKVEQHSRGLEGTLQGGATFKRIRGDTTRWSNIQED